MLKNKDFKKFREQLLSEKSSPQVNLVMPLVVNRLISVQELRAVAIKHLFKLSVEHDLFFI